MKSFFTGGKGNHKIYMGMMNEEEVTIKESKYQLHLIDIGDDGLYLYRSISDVKIFDLNKYGHLKIVGVDDI